MKERLFKIGVSDWKLEFEDDKIFMINTLVKETVCLESDGKTDLLLEDVCFDSEIIEYFKNGIQIKNVSQSFNLINGKGELQEEIEYIYLWVKLVNIDLKSKNEEVAIVTLHLKCD